jgi:excisionase family DNA binding protein
MIDDFKNPVLSVSEAQEILKIGKTKIYALLKAGAIPGKKLGRKTIILRADLNSYVESLPVYSLQPVMGGGKA